MVCVKTAVKTVETLVGFQAPALFQSSKEGLDRFTGILTHATYRRHAPLAYVVISKAGPTAQFLFRKPSPFPLSRPQASEVHIHQQCLLILLPGAHCQLHSWSTTPTPPPPPPHTTHPQRKQCYRTVKILSLPNRSITVSYPITIQYTASQHHL